MDMTVTNCAVSATRSARVAFLPRFEALFSTNFFSNFKVKKYEKSMVTSYLRAWKDRKRGVGPHADVTQTGPKQCSRFSSKSRCILNSKMLTLLYRAIIKEILCRISGQYLVWFQSK